MVGEGALMAQLSRARDRSMHSIVATIQAEQDKAIRAPGRGVVSISGGPGTGKTVVALHRAAYLLYSDRRRYESGGVLIVGPSGVFMRYIERVLPSLGETAVALRSLGEVVDGVKGTRHDDPAVADVKGAARMAELMRRTARPGGARRAPRVPVFYRDDTIVLTGRDLSALRRQLLSGGKRNRQLPRVFSALVDAMWRQVRGERGRDRGREEFVDTMMGNADFVEFARAWWPALDATDVLGWLRDPDLLARVGEGVVSQEDIALLSKSWSGAGDRARDYSVEDVALLDELRYQLGDVPESHEHDRDHEPDPLAHLVDEGRPEVTTASDREYATGPRTSVRTEDDGYAHVLVDEAQDLTPMQWRMVGRRGRAASWTIVGDPAQSSWPVRGGEPGPRGGARRQAAPRVPPLHELPQQQGDLRLRRRARRPGGPRRRPAERGPLHGRGPRGAAGRRPRAGGPRGRRGARRRRRGHGRDRRTGGPARLRAGLAGHLGRARRGPSRRRRRPHRGADRPRHEGPGVRRDRRRGAAGDRVGVRDRTRTLYVVLTRATQQMVTVSAG